MSVLVMVSDEKRFGGDISRVLMDNIHEQSCSEV